MRKIFIVALIVFSVGAFAQTTENFSNDKSEKQLNKNHYRKEKKHQKNRFEKFEKLNLSEAQKEQIQNLKSANRAIAKVDNKERKESFNSQMKQILTKEQFATFQEMEKNRFSNHSKHRRGFNDFSNLNLSDSQKLQMKELRMEFKRNNDFSKTEKQKPSKEQMLAYRTERTEKIKSILTEEQYAKFLENKEAHKRKQI